LSRGTNKNEEFCDNIKNIHLITFNLETR